ncbi:hypothetical protein FS749_012129 [Ceratobasidium sp. UAMH 11750]|nr:hypothetical protein FS749_012129 [Ceratobasidium sp. UAMH 11750]
MFSLDPRNPEEEHPWLDQDTSLDLIDRISRTCPHIETLRIFPKGIAQSGLDDEAYDKISNLQYLRSFTFSGTIVHERLLEILGQLPHLETLTFCTDYAETWEYDESPLDVPDDSFASLRQLYLYGLDESAMSRVCKVSRLFRHLVTAVIIFEDQCFDENMSDTSRSKVAVKSLGRNSPHLENLTIHPRGDNDPFVASWPVIDAFKYMPLRCLNLGEVYFDSDEDEDGEEDEDEGDEQVEEAEDDTGDENEDRGTSTQNRPAVPEWEYLLSAVPQLEELYLERQQLWPGLLASFASELPMLRLLVFAHVRLDAVVTSLDSGIRAGTATQLITLRAHSYFGSKVPYLDNAISTAARFIFRIWPNATCEARNPKSASDQRRVGGLNKVMESLRIEHG